MAIKDKIKELETLMNNTPNGVIRDADTILAEAVEKTDFEICGIAKEIFNVYKNSADKRAVKEMFYLFTGMDFKKYLDKCLAEMTR